MKIGGISLDCSLRIWKAGWVHALAGSNPAILRRLESARP